MPRTSTCPSLSPGSSPTHRRLSVRMKPKIKVKSPDLPPSQSRRVPLLKQLTSTLTKPATPPTFPSSRTTGKSLVTSTLSQQTKQKTVANISGISPIKNSPGQELVFKEHRPPPQSVKKMVLRSKVKSPVNITRRETFLVKEVSGGKFSLVKDSSGGKESSRGRVKTPRTKVEELVMQAKKKDMDIVNLTRRLNNIQKTLAEKEKSLKDLEVKIPKMLADLKRNLEMDEAKKKINRFHRDLKESMKRNRNLSGSMKNVEDQLKAKEDKLKEVIEDRKKVESQLKVKQKECREVSQNVSMLERKVKELQQIHSSCGQELVKEKERRGNLEIRYNKIFDENNMKDEFIEKLKTEVFHISNVASSRESEFGEAKKQNCELQSVLHSQSQRLTEQAREISSLQDLVHSRQLQGGREARGEEGKLDQATEEFLDRVTAVSRDRNMSVNLKLLVRKSQHSNVTDRSNILTGNYGSGVEATFSLHTDGFELFDEESVDEVFEKSADEVFEESGALENWAGSDEMSVDEDESEATGCSDYSVPSSGTFRRLEDLGVKVQGLWSKLETKEDTFDSLVQEQAHLTNSLSHLERDLDRSVLQHSSLVRKAGVVKKLFD